MFTPQEIEAIQQAIRQRYRTVAETSAAAKFPYLTGRDGALALGYEPGWLSLLPPATLATFCGVGNPFHLGAMHPGEAVLDIGCGAGVDLFVAHHFVGARGRVCGVDITAEMVAHAQSALRHAHLPHITVQRSSAEALPFKDATFDVVISNGVLNLSPMKSQAFAEIARVLKPHGRFQWADLVVREALPADVVDSLDAWSN